MQKNRQIQYKLILTRNFEIIKQIKHFYYYRPAIDEFDNMVLENNSSVIFPKKYTNQGGSNGGIQKLTYELVLLKRKSKNEPNTVLFDEFNRPYKVIVDEGEDFLVIRKSELFIEEDFHVFGFNPHTNRKNIDYILNKIIFNEEICKIKEIVMVKNKLVVLNIDNSGISIVICKTIEDCNRLYSKLYHLVSDNSKKSKNIYFLGVVNEYNKQKIYKLIMDFTGWDKKKLLRRNTRP